MSVGRALKHKVSRRGDVEEGYSRQRGQRGHRHVLQEGQVTDPATAQCVIERVRESS